MLGTLQYLVQMQCCSRKKKAALQLHASSGKGIPWCWNLSDLFHSRPTSSTHASVYHWNMFGIFHGRLRCACAPTRPHTNPGAVLSNRRPAQVPYHLRLEAQQLRWVRHRLGFAPLLEAAMGLRGAGRFTGSNMETCGGKSPTFFLIGPKGDPGRIDRMRDIA